MTNSNKFKCAPNLETERLLLRAHRKEDLENAAQMWADPLVTKFIGGKAFSRQQTWTKILCYTGHWKLMGFGYWALVEKSSGKFIGELGFADFKRELSPSIEGIPELGWVLAPQNHNKGIATEALKKVIHWSETELLWQKTVCLIHPENGASVRVAEKCGYKESIHTTYAGEPTILFARAPSK